MTTTKKKKSAREKRVLVASIICAATIVAGSTFAWFTSKDEVTNRLSANAKYDVSIAEDFQPPEEWIPGQTINKDVSAVNTGNVDAFVRMWLEGEMSVMTKASADIPATIAATTFTGANDANKVAEGDTMYGLGYTYYDATNKVYYKELSKTERANNALNGTDSATNDNTYSEVKAVQAGGYLVYAPENADWSYTAEQETEITTSTGKAVVAKDDVIGSSSSTASGANKLTVTSNCAIDSDTFTPVTPGLYIFRRNITLNATANTADTYEYSGYVFDGTHYFALANDQEGNSDYTLPTGAVTVDTSTTPQTEPLTYTTDASKIKLRTATEKIVKNDNLTWAYDATAKTLTATYYGAENSTTGNGVAEDLTDKPADNIVITVALDSANIGTTGQTWVAKTESGKTTTFYYNDDVEAGDSTAKLVDSVTLSSDTKQDAFIAFDFDLNVFLESIQVTMTEDGQESTAPITTSWAVADGSNIVASGTATEAKATELSDIAWS